MPGDSAATGGASAALEQGQTVRWRCADHPDAVGEVHVKKVVPDQLIVFEWPSSEGGYNTRAEMKFEPLNPRETLVSITEWGWKDTEEGHDIVLRQLHGMVADGDVPQGMARVRDQSA